MRKELDEALCAAYPLIFKNRRGDVRKTLMCWGFECGDGWYDLINTTCALLYRPYRQAAQDYADARENEGTAPYAGAAIVTAVDVERKRLMMTAAAETLPVAVQVKEKFGTLRFYVDGADARARALIEFAESHSGRVCEECGAPGKVRGPGWYRTRCEAHANTQ